jgi:hypothetical protein
MKMMTMLRLNMGMIKMKVRIMMRYKVRMGRWEMV